MVHYKFVFKGYMTKTIQFDGTSNDRHFREKDGYLYIDGHKITNKESAKRVIYSNSDDGNLSLRDGEAWVDSVFAIDSEGNVICTSFKHAGSRFNRFMDWITGTQFSLFY